MNKKSSPYLLSLILCLLFFLLLYLFTEALSHFSFSPWGWQKALFSSLLVNMFLLYSPLQSKLCALLPLCLSLSVYIIFYHAVAAVPYWYIYSAIGFHTAIYILLLLPLLFIANIKLKKVYSFLALFLFLCPLFLFWAYFLISHTWPLPDTLIAVLQTDATEAWEYLKAHISWSILLIFALLCLCIYHTTSPLSLITYKKQRVSRILVSFVMFASSLALITISLDNPILLLINDSCQQIEEYQRFKEMQAHASPAPPISIEGSPAKGLFVLVIGESQNRSHMSAYGYPLPTTPWLQGKEENPHFLRFTQPYSCHVQTVQVLSYALTNKNQYNDIPLEQATTLVEVAKAAGYETYWISNQAHYGAWETPTSVIADACDHQIWANKNSGDNGLTTAYDEAVTQYISQVSDTGNALLIVHLMGNHRPYLLRYPPAYNLFHHANAMREHYDNSMRYNDEVMKQLYETLQKNPDFRAMAYCADHGEGIDEGLAHDVTAYHPSITYIPFYMAFSDSYMQSYPETLSHLRSHQNDIFTNDLLFNAMLGLMHIRPKGLYEPENDITSDRYDATPSRFRTLFGKKPLEE